MYDLVLKNSKLIDENNEVYIGINDGKIAKISKSLIKGEKEIDLNGNLVLPGLIDPHVHLETLDSPTKKILKQVQWPQLTEVSLLLWICQIQYLKLIHTKHLKINSK